jgi:uncharacterized protein (TIGR02147 family)
MKTIYQFIDYRAFLKHFYEEKKRTTRHFSHRYFLNKAGINSSSFLRHVIEGRRNLTQTTLEKFAAALDLTPKETTYFRHLVLFNQARTAAAKQEHYAVLRSMIGGVKETLIKARQFDYYNKWYTSIIRELICLYNFDNDYAALAKAIRPNIKVTEARHAVRDLIDLGLIKKKDNGGYEQTSQSILADDTVTSLGLRSFVAWMARYTEDAIAVYTPDERYISTVTMGISEPTFRMLTEEIEAFKDRVKSIVSQDENSSRVYQFNLALFPMSEDMAGAAGNREERK